MPLRRTRLNPAHTTAVVWDKAVKRAKRIMVNNVLPRRPSVLGSAKRKRARALLAAVLLLAAPGRVAAGSEPGSFPVAADWRTGLAMHGFDPVAYFAEGRAPPGSPAFEQQVGSATWRFRNEGNLAAFAASPSAYAPRFGGYDAVALGRGVATAGNPLLWLMHEGRLFLFHDAAARAAFREDPRGSIAAAERGWPLVRTTLLP